MRILILSNNCLSHINSNGRTMLNMLNNFKNNEIYNFFIHGNLDDNKIANFYKIDEIKLIKSPFSNNLIHRVETIGNNKTFNKKNKTVFKRLIRIIIWKNPLLIKQILKITKEINPEAIVIQCGDSSFLINVAVKISKKLNIPLISYNSEDYIFKKWDYFNHKEHRGILFRIFQYDLIKSYDKLYKQAKSFIYLIDSIKDLYLEKYPKHKAYVIYNSSTLTCFDNNKNNDFLYLGNVSLGRGQSLIIISKLIYKYFDKKLNIYTSTKDEKDISILKQCDSVILHDEVPYKECVNLINNCKAIIHTECLDPFYEKDIKNGFSTKIADSVSSGKPFIVLVSKVSFIYKYLKTNDCAHVFTNINDLDCFLKEVSFNDKLLYSKKNNQIEVSLKNHSSKLNSITFYNIIKEALN